MAEKKKLTTAEILAAARAAKAGAGGTPSPAAEPATAGGEPAAAPASAPPAKPAPAGAKPATAAGGRPSVAEIMAMARAKKAAEGETPAAAPAPKPAAPKPAAAKAPTDKPPAKAAAAKPMARDTASILAAARAGAKPGPVSKAEAPAAPRPAAARPAGESAPKAAPAKLPSATLPPKPTKPVAAKKGADAVESRRGFLEMALGSFMATGFTALSMTGGLFGLGLARYMFPNVLAEPPSRFKVGFREGFPSGKVETKYVAQYGVWVVNSDVGGQQQIYALKTVCTHLGCTPNWLEAEQKFKCPCHGSGFYKDGVNFEGPAPRPLERYAIKVSDDGQLEVDKSRTFHEELGQWADPDSYIQV